MATIIKHTRLNIRDKKACKRPISHIFLHGCFCRLGHLSLRERAVTGRLQLSELVKEKEEATLGRVEAKWRIRSTKGSTEKGNG